MNHIVTTTLSENFFSFLWEEAKRKKTTKKAIIEKWLEYYKKLELEKQIVEGLKNRQEEYKDTSKSFRESQFNSIRD